MKRILTTFTVLLISATACNLPAQGSPPLEVPTDELVATALAATQQANGQAPAAETPSSPDENTGGGLLPYSLYFISDDGGNGFQVYRLEADGVTRHAVTNEPDGVTSYSVNPVDGSVAYLTQNQVHLVNVDGSGKRMLVDGGPIDENDDRFNYELRIVELAFSPDGSMLAFGRGGLNIYTLSDGNSVTVLPNELSDRNGLLFPDALYVPHSWSEDGGKLLITVGLYEGSRLAILDMANGGIMNLQSAFVCCQVAWGMDDTSLYVGSPYLGQIESGLWRYAIADGAKTELIGTNSPDGTFNFVGWPQQLSNGDLQYFYANMPDIPSGDASLTLVRTGPDGVSGRAQLRPESQIIFEALWSPAGDLVILVQPIGGDAGYPRRGAVVLMRVDGSPNIPLAANGYGLQWGP